MTLSRDKKYYFVATYPVRDPNREGWSVEVPQSTWWMLGMFVLLCYALGAATDFAAAQDAEDDRALRARRFHGARELAPRG